MKVVGLSLSGHPIVEIDDLDRREMRSASNVLMSLASASGEAGGTAVDVKTLGYVQPAPIAPVQVVKRHYKKRATKAEVLDTNRDKVCKICGKKFHDNSPRNTMVTCEKASCQLEHKREYQRAWYDKHRKAKKTTAPAPAAKPDRVAMLKSINARITEKDPVDEMSKLARAAAQEGC
jgi:hypothetical protein